MKTLNKVQLIGHLGRDPEMRYTQNGTAVCTLSLATNRYRNSADGQGQEDTEWHRVVLWDKLAETVNTYLRKGSKVYLEGRLQSRKWKDAQGQDHTTVEVVATEMIMLDGSNGAGRRPAEEATVE